MTIDYSKIPTNDLKALVAGDYSKVSTPTLKMITQGNKSPGVLTQLGQGIHEYVTQKSPSLPKVVDNPFSGAGQVTKSSDNPFTAISKNQYQPDMPNSLATRIGEGVIPFASALGAGIATGGLGEAAAAPLIDAIPEASEATRLGRGLNVARKGLTASLKSAAGGAASAPALGVTPSSGAAWGAAFGPLGEAVSRIPKLPAAILGGKSRALKGARMGAEEAAQSFNKIPQELNLPIGDMINSKNLQRMYQKLRAIPFSGTDAAYDDSHNLIKQNILDATGISPENLENLDVNTPAFEQTANAYQQAVNNTHNKFSNLAEMADQSANKGFDKSALDNAIKEAKDEIGKKIVNKTSAARYKPITDLLDDYDQTDIPDFRTAINVGHALNDEFGANLKPEDKLMRRYIGKLKSGLEQSIDDNASIYPELGDLRREANEARKYQSTFEKLPNGNSTEFHKIYNSLDNNDIGNFVNRFLSSSKGLGDNSAKLENLTRNLSPDLKRAIYAKYINPDGKQTIPNQIKKMASLNRRQTQLLLDDKAPLIDQIRNISSLYPDSKNPAFVERTGLLGGKGLAGLGLGVGATLHHAAIPFALGAIGGSRALGAALRSNWLKDAYLNSLKADPLTLPSIVSRPTKAYAIANLGDKNNGK